MGAIAVYLSRGQLPNSGVAARMLSAAPHRGSATELMEHGSCSLGATNTPDRRNAWVASKNGLASAFCGVLDNEEELTRRFWREATPPRDAAALVLAIFEAMGDDVASVLRGAFGGVVTNGSELWCFRDQVGFGPLFYRREPGRFFAATEAKQVVAGSDISKEPDLDVVERIFWGDVDDDTPCALKGVERLPKATVLATDGVSTRRRRYWDPEAFIETADPSDDELGETFMALMTQAVHRCLTGSDAVALSGGVDSPTVACLGAPEHFARWNRPIGAVSALYPRYPNIDERKYIELVARDRPIELHTFEARARPLDGLQEWVRVCDGPASVIAVAEAAEMYRITKGCGYTTLLGGDLAEFVMDRRDGLMPYLLARGRVSALMADVRRRRAGGRRWAGILRELASVFVPTPLLLHRVRTRRWDDFPAWMDERIARQQEAKRYVSPRERWRKGQMAFFVGPGIGLESDEICAAVCGVQPRRPWADVDLSEFFLSLRAEVKFPDYKRKTLVRTLLRGTVPDAILDRTDHTVFTDFVLDNVDYPELRRWVVEPPERITGVDYRLLAEHLATENLGYGELKWATDLAKAHAFLALWH